MSARVTGTTTSTPSTSSMPSCSCGEALMVAGYTTGRRSCKGTNGSTSQSLSLSSVIRHPEYTRARLAQASGRLRERVYPELGDPDELLVAGPVGGISHDEAAALDYRRARLGARLGPLWATYWFRLSAKVPDEWRGTRVDLLWRTTAETTVWRDGRAVQGLHGIEPS